MTKIDAILKVLSKKFGNNNKNFDFRKFIKILYFGEFQHF